MAFYPTSLLTKVSFLKPPPSIRSAILIATMDYDFGGSTNGHCHYTAHLLYRTSPTRNVLAYNEVVLEATFGFRKPERLSFNTLHASPLALPPSYLPIPSL